VGWRAAEQAAGSAGAHGAVPTICMATAHPAKFGEAIRRATGRPPVLPEALAALERLPERVTVLPAEAARVRALIAETLRARGVPLAPVAGAPLPVEA
jgi:threonine synthase